MDKPRKRFAYEKEVYSAIRGPRKYARHINGLMQSLETELTPAEEQFIQQNRREFFSKISGLADETQFNGFLRTHLETAIRLLGGATIHRTNLRKIMTHVKLSQIAQGRPFTHKHAIDCIAILGFMHSLGREFPSHPLQQQRLGKKS